MVQTTIENRAGFLSSAKIELMMSTKLGLAGIFHVSIVGFYSIIPAVSGKHTKHEPHPP